MASLNDLPRVLEVAQSANAAERQGAESALGQLDAQPGYLTALLQLLAGGALPAGSAVLAAIQVKNKVKRDWEFDLQENNRVADADRELLKREVVNVMLATAGPVQRTLGEAVTLVSRTDFPEKWPSLLPQLAQRLAGSDLAQIACVLRTANDIFCRYSSEMRSDALFTEIKYVLGVFAKPLLELYERCLGALQGAADPRPAFALLDEVMDAFYYLNYQDIPEFFEDTMERWWTPMQALLGAADTHPAGDTETESPLDRVRARICRAANLYAGKYDDTPFRQRVGPLVQQVWSLLTSLGEETRYDALVTSAVRFLNTVASQAWNAPLFAQDETLRSLCERVIVPQLKLRQSDVEQFEYDAVEYIRRDIEGSDVDTRRRTASDFVRALCRHYEEKVTAILKNYVMVLLEQYKANPAQNWVAKDAAMYIVLSLAGRVSRGGVARVNPFVQLGEFLGMHVLPELQGDINDRPVLKADCLKFVTTFRAQLPPDSVAAILPLLVRHLGSANFVVHTYAARAVDRLLVARVAGGAPLVSAETLAPQVEGLLDSLFKTLAHPDSAENAYVMRAILRVCQTAGKSTAPLASVVIRNVTGILARVCKNPRDPQFNHYLFETLACLVKNICQAAPAQVEAFEGSLFPVFQEILGMSTCEEFHAYTFQIIGMLLHFNKERMVREGRPAEVPAVYQGLWPSFLRAQLWLNNGNVPALVSLLRVYLSIGGAFIHERLTPVLGIFQQLLSVKRVDHCGMELLEAVVSSVPVDKLQPLLPEVFRLLFKRLQTGKTAKYVKNLIGFFSLFVVKHGMAGLTQCADTVQPGIMAMVLERVWLPALDTVAYSDRKLVVAAMTRMLVEDPAKLGALWPRVLQGVVLLFEGVEEDVGEDDADLVELAASGFSTSFNQLAFASLPEPNPLAGTPLAGNDSGKVFVAQQIASLSQRMPGSLPGLVSQMDEKSVKAFSSYMAEAKVQLA